MGQPHEKHQGALQLGQAVKVIPPALGGVGGDHMKTPAQPPVGHRNARQGGNGNGGGDAGHHLEGDARRLEGQSLLAASAKDKRVASLEPDHPHALPGQLYQSSGDFLLGGGVAAQPLAHIDAPGLGRSGLEQLIGDEIVVDHRVALAQQLQPPQGDKVGLAAARADEVDTAGRLAHGSSSVSRLSKGWISSRGRGPPE